jgi:hypothetical protein
MITKGRRLRFTAVLLFSFQPYSPECVEAKFCEDREGRYHSLHEDHLAELGATFRTAL